MNATTIARLLHQNVNGEGPLEPLELAEMFADSLELDDRNFDRDKFLTACGHPRPATDTH